VSEIQRAIIRKRELKRRVPLSDTTIWRHERAGTFPQRIVLSDSGLVGWYEDEIDEWVRDRIRAGDKRPAGVTPAVAPSPRTA
jgi:predicted DNA-binding transcriptional regulator AlpA